MKCTCPILDRLSYIHILGVGGNFVCYNLNKASLRREHLMKETTSPVLTIQKSSIEISYIKAKKDMK